MKAITTKFLGPTSTKPARIVASDMDGNRVTVSYDSTNGSGMDAFESAASDLCAKMGWQKNGELMGGRIEGGYVFVFVPPVAIA